MFQIIGAMAEFERSLIQERVRAGLRNAKLKGKDPGKAAPHSQQRRDDTAARKRNESYVKLQGSRCVSRYSSHASLVWKIKSHRLI